MEDAFNRSAWKLGMALTTGVLAGATVSALAWAWVLEVPGADQRPVSTAVWPASPGVEPTRGPPVSAAPVSEDSACPARASAEGVEQRGRNAYVITRCTLTALLNPPAAIGRGRPVPAFEHGIPQGIKLFNITDGSVYGRLGFQAGDIVTRVDAYDLDDPARWREAYEYLKIAQRIEVEIERRGQMMTKVYDVLP